MWFLTQAAVQVKPHLWYNDSGRGRYQETDGWMQLHRTLPLEFPDLKHNAVTQTTYILIYKHTYTLPAPRSSPVPRPAATPHSPSLPMLIAPPDLRVSIGPFPPRGQVHCQSGWHIVFHSTNQQTASWWVSTLVVKVTFDGWEGYGSECCGDSRQLVP